MKNVFLLEDQPGHAKLLCDVVREVFQDESNITEARSYKEGLEYLHDYNRSIDIALIDVELPDGSGIAFLKQTKRIRSQCQCIIVTLFDDMYLLDALKAGMEGYLIKEFSKENMVKTLRKILDGEPPLSPRIARKILEISKETVDQHLIYDMDKGENHIGLTAREKEILKSISRGFNDREIAEALEIAPSTVKTHVKNIYKKLDVSKRAQAAVTASRLGLLNGGRSVCR